jgi:methyl-accepting chemotaxis protein-2 (aspartate sensor receptor)
MGKGIVLALAFVLASASIAFMHERDAAPVAAPAKDQIEATIFSYDGQDFVRTKTTLVTQEGKSAVNTKLERDTPAYKALIAKHSYTGDATAFGHNYDANYAPLTDADGRLTGALFVGVAKS